MKLMCRSKSQKENKKIKIPWFYMRVEQRHEVFTIYKKNPDLMTGV